MATSSIREKHGLKSHWWSKVRCVACLLAIGLHTYALATKIPSSDFQAAGLGNNGTKGYGKEQQEDQIDPKKAISQSSKPLLDSATLWGPLFRVVIMIILGMYIHAARLAWLFRPFRWLGIFANFYSLVFILLGGAVCVVLAFVSEGSLPSRWPVLSIFGSAIVTSILPSNRFRLRRPARDESANSVPDLPDTSNLMYGWILDGVSDCVMKRMQERTLKAARQYSWDVIKLAARLVLREEMPAKFLTLEQREAALKDVVAIEPAANRIDDLDCKYDVLVRLLKWGSFRRLNANLILAEEEDQCRSRKFSA